MNSLVSIIIPVYNVSKYLRICLDSVISQTYKNIEIILIDDGSEDDSGKIVDEYEKKDFRVKVIHKNNEGVSKARNVGIEESSGEWVCFADADDILESDYVEYLLFSALEKGSQIALTTDMFTTFHRGKQKKNVKNEVTGEKAVERILYYDIPIGCYCKIFKRELLGCEVRFYEGVFVGEGFNFNVLAFSKAKSVTIGNRKIYCYRRDNMSSCMTDFKLSKCEMALKAVDIIKEKLSDFNDDISKALNFAVWHTYTDMYNWMVLAKVKMQYPLLYNKCYNEAKSYSYHALFAPVNRKEKLRAFLQFINPRLLAFMLEVRRYFLSK